MAEDLRNLVEDLASSYPDGEPVLVLVGDYLERERLATELTEEASLYGIQIETLSRLEDAERWRPTPDGSRGRAALVLIDPGTASAWGPWLEANREAFPQWVRFFVVLAWREDVPALAKTASFFMSWAKGLEIQRLSTPSLIPAQDVADELARLERETGMSADAFVEAWRRGELPDTFRNTTWLNLAWAASRRERG